jgi:hypothetical protein
MQNAETPRTGDVVATVHLALMVFTMVALTGVAITGLIGSLRDASAQPWIDRWLLAALIGGALACLSGVAQLATGARPHEGLHIVYGIAILAVPAAARYASRPARSRHQIGLLTVAAAIGLVIGVRLVQTG